MDLGYVTVGMVPDSFGAIVSQKGCGPHSGKKEALMPIFFAAIGTPLYDRSGCTVGCQCLHYDARRKGGLSQGSGRSSPLGCTLLRLSKKCPNAAAFRILARAKVFSLASLGHISFRLIKRR